MALLTLSYPVEESTPAEIKLEYVDRIVEIEKIVEKPVVVEKLVEVPVQSDSRALEEKILLLEEALASVDTVVQSHGSFLVGLREHNEQMRLKKLKALSIINTERARLTKYLMYLTIGLGLNLILTIILSII